MSSSVVDAVKTKNETVRSRFLYFSRSLCVYVWIVWRRNDMCVDHHKGRHGHLQERCGRHADVDTKPREEDARTHAEPHEDPVSTHTHSRKDTRAFATFPSVDARSTRVCQQHARR